MDEIIDQLFQLKPGKPGGEHIFPHRGLEAGTHPHPEVALERGRIAHDRVTARFDGGRGGRGGH
jgi:hypothetical protein